MKHFWPIDLAALGTMLGSALGYLPYITAGFAAVYYIMLMISWVVNKGWKPK